MSPIKDGKGRLLGFLKDSVTHIQAYSHTGILLGYYHKGQRKTFDGRGIIFSNTDSTVSLIHSNSATR